MKPIRIRPRANTEIDALADYKAKKRGKHSLDKGAYFDSLGVRPKPITRVPKVQARLEDDMNKAPDGIFDRVRSGR